MCEHEEGNEAREGTGYGMSLSQHRAPNERLDAMGDREAFPHPTPATLPPAAQRRPAFVAFAALFFSSRRRTNTQRRRRQRAGGPGQRAGAGFVRVGGESGGCDRAGGSHEEGSVSGTEAQAAVLLLLLLELRLRLRLAAAI